MITVDRHTSGAWIASSAPTPMEVPVQSSRPLGWQEMPEYCAHAPGEPAEGDGEPRTRESENTLSGYPMFLEMFREFTLW